jgi:cobalamin biosynthesis protein CbiD
MIVPPDVAAMGKKAVSAYVRGYARTEARLAELAKHPAVVGRASEAITLLQQGHSNAEIVAHLTKDRRARVADDVWSRARAAIDRSTPKSASEKAPADRAAAQSKTERADAVWARAYSGRGN